MVAIFHLENPLLIIDKLEEIFHLVLEYVKQSFIPYVRMRDFIQVVQELHDVGIIVTIIIENEFYTAVKDIVVIGGVVVVNRLDELGKF